MSRWVWFGMMALLVAILAVTGSPGAGAEDERGEPRIVGGTPAAAGEYPSQVAMLLDADRAPSLPEVRPGWVQWCGGSVVDPSWILTAARCVEDRVPADLQVLAGTIDLETGGDLVPVASIVRHPSFAPATSANDVALLELERPVKVAVSPLARPGDEVLFVPGTSSIVTGWGATAPDGTGSTLLLETSVPVISDGDCATAYGTDFVASSMVCAGDLEDGGEDACDGDAGGPLVVDGPGPQLLQMGIFSWGGGDPVSTSCAHPDYPGVYARVTALFGWIEDQIGAPANDAFASASTPSCGVSTDTRSSQFTTIEASEPNATGASLWYRFTAIDHGQLHVNTLGSDLDTVLRVYAGTGELGSLPEVGSSDDIAPGVEVRSEVDVHVVPGQTVWIQVEGKDHGPGGPERGMVRTNISFDPDTKAQFPDVATSSIFNADIEWMANAGTTTGTPACDFLPTASVTRQSMSAFLYRALGWSRDWYPAPGFSDVPGGHLFAEEIAWMADSGITSGYPDATFKPNDAVTRASMAAFLYRAAGSPDGADPECTEAPFPDVATSHIFCGEIAWLVDTGITGGFADGTYKPANNIARQHMAAFLHDYAMLDV